MKAQLIDGKALAAQVKAEAAAETAALKEKGVTPCLAVILVGEDPPARSMSAARPRTAASAALTAV